MLAQHPPVSACGEPRSARSGRGFHLSALRGPGIERAMRKVPGYLAVLGFSMSALVAAADEPGSLVPGDRFRPRPVPMIEPAPVQPTITPTPAKRGTPPPRAARPRARPAHRPAPLPGDGRVQF